MKTQFKWAVGTVAVCYTHGKVTAETEAEAREIIRSLPAFKRVEARIDNEPECSLHISEASACGCEMQS